MKGTLETGTHVDENDVVEPTVQILRRGHVTWIGVTLVGHGAPFVREVVILDALAPYFPDFTLPPTVHASGSVAPGWG